MIVAEAPVIRRMQPQDVDAVAAMEASVFTDAWSREAFAGEVFEERSLPVVVFNVGGDLLAYMIAWFVVDEAHLGNIAVTLSARRKGIAQQLLDFLFTTAQARKTANIFLEVRASNQAAQALYARNGFEVISVREQYYVDDREDALVMKKPMRDQHPEGS